MLSKEEAEKILAPHYPGLLECVDSGWNDYKEIFQPHQSRLELRTRASNVRDLIVDNVRKKYFKSQNPRIAVDKPNGLFILSIDDIIFARSKKIKSDYTTANIFTQQTLDFINGELFPEYLKKAVVNIGYMVDSKWDRLGSYICCPNGKYSYLWKIDLNENVLISNTGLINLEFEEEDNIDDINEIRKVINPKKEKKSTNKKSNIN